MKKMFLRIKPLLFVSAMTLVVSSCSNDAEDPVGPDTALLPTEVKTILEIDGISSAADDVVRELFNANQSGMTAKSEACYQAMYSDTGFTVSFDNCSPDENGELYNGTLSVVYGTDSDSFAYTINFDNLIIGDIALDGTRSFSFDAQQDNSIVFEVTSDMMVTMADGAVNSEKGSKTFAIVFDDELGQGMLSLEGDWIVKLNDNTYTVSVPQLLEANFGCDYIGKGLMLLNKNGLEVSVDFGDGGCDDIAELAYPDGTKENISLK